LLCKYPVWPWAELGIGDTRAPTGQARWNVSRWDQATARWASTEPTWLDVSCEVHDAHSFNGRDRMVDRFIPGTADVTFRNEDGWADLTPHPVPPAALPLRPGRQLRYGVDTATGRHVLWRGYIDEALPIYAPYGSDVVETNGFDALTEAGRAPLAAVASVGAGETVTARLGRILDAAAWPPTYRDVDASGVTLQATTLGAATVDLLGQAAESAGGALFGDLTGRVAFRARDWATYLPGTPPDAVVGNIDPAAVCPATWELSWRRRDVAAVVTMGRADDVSVTVVDQTAQTVIGPEPFERADLITADVDTLGVLAGRALETRAYTTMPRVEAVTLDAANDPGDGRVVELMATARPETPTRLRCQLAARDGRVVFDADMFVTAVDHTITDTGRWSCRLTLDVAAPYAAAGGRWDRSRWDLATWGVAVADLVTEARALAATIGGLP
jgi:hypothetical protein